MRANALNAAPASIFARCTQFLNKGKNMNTEDKEKKMIPYRMITGIIAGAALGFVYYKLAGCRANT